MNEKQQLSKELRQAGASASEISQLLPIAADLHLLKAVGAPSAHHFGWRRILMPAVFIVPAIAAGMLVVILSKTVLPTSWLFPVQQLADNVATRIQPDYKAQLMMKRAQQVNQLVGQKADSGIIMATLANYADNARTYKSQSHANYAALEYCKTNLEQAATKATPPIKNAINASLQSLET